MFRGAIFDGFPSTKGGRRVVSTEVREALAKRSTLYRYWPKAVAYYQEGDESNEANTKLHFVVKGVMRIEGRYKDRVVHARFADAEDDLENMFGEIEAIDAEQKFFMETPNMATARAETEAMVIEIEYDDYSEVELTSVAMSRNMRQWLVRRSFKHFSRPLHNPNVTAKEALDIYVEGLLRTEPKDESGEIKKRISLADLIEATGGVSRQRIYDLLKVAKDNGEYEFDARRHRIKILKSGF